VLYGRRKLENLDFRKKYLFFKIPKAKKGIAK
jgi:hypothetical protein